MSVRRWPKTYDTGQVSASAGDEHAADQGLDSPDRRLTFLLRASEALASSLDLSETVVALADLAVPDLADGCAVHLVQGSEVVLVAAAHIDHGRERVLAGLAARREPTDDDVARRVVDDEKPFLDERARRLWIPLRRDGRALGVVSLAMEASDRSLGPDDLPVIEEFVRCGAVAIDHALRYRGLVRETRNLQRSLLPSALPTIGGLQLAARYRPAPDGLGISGDFLDVFPTSDHAWGVAVGDVSGRGVQAATLTALLRQSARASAEGGDAPSRVLAAVNRAVLAAGTGERFATMAFAAVRAVDGRAEATVALAGHPRPFVITSGGAVRSLGVPGGPIGVKAVPDVSDEEVTLAPGEALVLVTDGLSEARAPQGMWWRTLEETARRAARQDAAGLAAALEPALLQFQDESEPDDLGLVVLRVPTAEEAVQGAPLDERLPTQPIAAYVARTVVRPWLEDQHLDGWVAEDVVLVVSELVTNAARVAVDHVDLRVWRTPSTVVVEVTDDGEGFVPPPDSTLRPAPQAEAGRGLWLVQMASDDCQYNPGPWGTVVRCRFDLETAGSPARR